jgi:hypothetical protein
VPSMPSHTNGHPYSSTLFLSFLSYFFFFPSLLLFSLLVPVIQSISFYPHLSSIALPYLSRGRGEGKKGGRVSLGLSSGCSRGTCA